jgi:predicted CXXCH cytochrome family protein
MSCLAPGARALALALCLAPSLAVAAPAPAKPAAAPAKAAAAPAAKASPLAPLPAATPGLFTHAPFESGSCTPCHERDDAKNPGKIDGQVNAICKSCHSELEEIMARKHKHPPTEDSCTNCHNPHNATIPKFLLAETSALCGECHAGVVDEANAAKVKHGALAQGAKCANCHNPHGSAVEKLLVKLPLDLCLGCHDKEGMKSADGRPLTNMKAWLTANKQHHGPVEAGDCSACHKPHGGPSFRLLKEEYPASFYAPFDKANYALCFSCHNEAVFTTRETATLTDFRHGSKNLHFVHVNRGERGRTCRACHEVHASQQDHHIREAVPYGNRGWMLKLNYSKAADGGSCAKTCHETRVYKRGPDSAAASRK